MTIWTQDTINKWALETFGEASPNHMMARAIQECSELLMEITKVDIDQVRIAEECADIVGPLCRVAEWCHCDITPVFEAIDFVAPNHLYGPALRVMSKLVFLMERMGPQNVFQKDNGAKQIGSIVIDLAEICASVDIKLGDAIDKKMEILLTRKWVLDGNGAGQHVRDGFPSARQHYDCQFQDACQPGVCKIEHGDKCPIVRP